METATSLRLILVAGLTAVALLGARASDRPRTAELRAAASGSVEIRSSRDNEAIIDATGFKPGDVASGTLELSNPASAAQRLRLDTTSLRDAPGAAGGVLSRRLDLRVERVRGGVAQDVFRGPLADLDDLNLGTLSPAEAETYRFTVALPEGGALVDDAYAGGSVEVGWRWHGEHVGEAGAGNPAPDASPAPRAAAAEPPRADAAAEPNWDGPAPAAGRPVRLWVGGSSSQRLGRAGSFGLVARCRPACRLTASARVKVGRKWITLPWRRLRPAGPSADATRMRFRLSRGETHRLRRALRGRPATARLTVRAAAPGQASSRRTRAIRLRP